MHALVSVCAHMHLYFREFAYVYTRKCIIMQFLVCVCVSAFVCVSSHRFN